MSSDKSDSNSDSSDDSSDNNNNNGNKNNGDNSNNKGDDNGNNNNNSNNNGNKNDNNGNNGNKGDNNGNNNNNGNNGNSNNRGNNNSGNDNNKGNNNNGNNNNNNGNNNNGNNNNKGANNNNNNQGGNNNNNNQNKSPPPLPPPPPPPPLHSRAVTPGHKSHASYGKESNDSSKAIIGGVAAGAALLLILLLLCCISYCRKRRRKKHDQMYFNNDSPEFKRNDYFGAGGNNNSWSKPEPAKNSFRRPQPPTTTDSANVSSEYRWPIAPPPPPPMMTSSELNSVSFSGPYFPPQPPPHPSIALGFDKGSFTYEELVAATGSFTKSNLLGQGGFGYVYKGVLSSGKEVAVKSLKSDGGQGEREFQAEVDIISRVHHRHLVGLVGYCISGSKRMLVYEYIPNNTLEFHLYEPGNPVMDWPLRVRTALGAAKGFAYLHEDCHPKIIHRDIKVSNILLDEHFEAKVSDFGLAKLSADNYTHVSTRIMGTFGYLAPEYASSGKLTEKSDVYSFGVVLLELITGKRPIDVVGDDETLIDWSRPILMRASEGGSYEELVDKNLQNNYDPQQMRRMVACAAGCLRHSGRRRPKMSQIVRTLEGNASLDDLQDKGNAGQGFSSDSNADYDSHSYNIKLRGTGRSNQDSSSSEHGLSSGEHDSHNDNKAKRLP